MKKERPRAATNNVNRRYRWMATVLLCILFLIVIFHVIIITGIIHYGIVWGGRLKSREEMLRFESISVLLNILMMFVAAARAGFIKAAINNTIITIALWMMAGLFLLNTLGNFMSHDKFERLVFTPLTFVLFVLCFMLAGSHGKKQ